MFWLFKRVTERKACRKLPLMVEGLERRAVPSTVTVIGQANIYAAGLSVPAAPPAPGGGGGGRYPTAIDLSTLGSPSSLYFPSVTGTVSARVVSGHFNGPDGGPFFSGATHLPAWKGISGIRDDHATMFLVGVFLGPNGQPVQAPPSLDVSRANSATIAAPLLGQQFFIGDGRTVAQALQRVIVPAGAAKLYLGFADGYDFGRIPGTLPGAYGDNGGALSVQVTGFNTDQAAAYLDRNAQSGSTGQCALYVRKALEAGGMDTTGRPAVAKAYGPFLLSRGFSVVNSVGYVPRKGDIVVIQPYAGGSPEGHIAMFDGVHWVSDFQQNDFWGGPGYRKNQVAHRFYRP